MATKAVAFRWTLAATLLGVTVWLSHSYGKQNTPPAGGGPEIKTASDEPPIRVKGGSVEMTLMPNGIAPQAVWKKDSSGKGWSVDKGKGNSDKIGLLILYHVSQTIPCRAAASGLNTVTITFHMVPTPPLPQSADRKIVFTRHNHISHFVPDNNFTPSPTDPNVLMDNSTGYIKSIYADNGKVNCSFTQKSDLDEFYVFEQ